VDRQESVAVVVRVEERELLAAMRRIPGIVNVEHDVRGHLGPAVAELVDQRRLQPHQRAPGHPVLQPRHRRLRAQRLARPRPASHRQLEDRIATQGIAIVGVLVAGGDREHAEAQHLRESVADALGIAPVGNAGRQPFGEPDLALDLAQQQHAAVRRLQAARECNLNLLAFDR
jgi:hypothetical protein